MATDRGSQNQNQYTGRSGGHGRGRGGRSERGARSTRIRRTPKEIAQMKAQTPCHQCKVYCHWSDAHNDGGTVKLGTSSHASSEDAKSAFLARNNLSKPQQVEENKNAVIGLTAWLATSMAHQNFSTSTAGKTLVYSLTSIPTSCLSELGPLVDNGAPFCPVGNVELRAMSKRLFNQKWVIGEKSPELSEFDFWQYGSGSHSSSSPRIVGSVALSAVTNNGKPVSIRHLVIEGSSQWILGRKVIRKCHILHIGRHAPELPVSSPDSMI